MKERIQVWMEKAKSVLTLITHRKTVKSARITYQVFWNLFLLVLTVLILGGSFATGVGAGYFASLVKDEPIRSYDSMKKDIYNYTETSDLYFANDVYLGRLRTDLVREEVKLDHVSKDLANAVIATEDEYFYQHKGVVPKAVFRALFQEVTNSAVQSGGSTLTQQLIKNQILTNEVSFQRKANEILLALRLEKFFDKKEILEAYLNVSTFGRNSSGQNIAGVQAAAKGIFGKNASDLSLPQAAFIAGLPQSPFGYTPFTREGTVKNNLEPGLTRMKTVLKRMVDGGYINQQQYAEASAYDITKDFTPPAPNPLEKYPWLTFEIEKRAVEVLTTVLAEKDGYTEKDLKNDDTLFYKYKTLATHDLHQNGYQIHSTIDKDIFDAMQVVKDNYKNYGPDKAQQKEDPETKETITVMEPVEVGAELIENKTGKIISFVAGRDYDKQKLNHATSAVRQNGSTMKPLLVYGPAIELGKAAPGTPLPDVALSLAPGKSTPWPRNYDLRYSGIVSARYALAKSYNVPAVKLYRDIVDQQPAKYLEKMGFTSLIKPDFENLSTAIGSLENGVTIEENTNAFSTFANNGKFIDAYMIDKIVDKDGKVVYQHEVKPVDVFKPQTAYLTLDMMRDVIKSGTAAGVNSKLNFRADWAGKTGTGNEYIDSWFVATNPNVTFGIWTGYDTPKSLKTSGMSYSQRTNNLWAELLNSAYSIKPELVAPKETFQMPEGIVKRSYCAVSGLLPSSACSKAGLVESDYFNVNDVPKKVDDSLVESKFVTINGKKYLALDSTPQEFSQFGVILNPDFITRMVGKNFRNTSQLIPKKDRWGKILVPDAKMVDNGKSPDGVSLTVSGNTITWTSSPDNDIVGYRVYQGGTKVASIVSGSSLSFTGGNGDYHVTAVDIAGKESAPSNHVAIGAVTETEQPTP
ncbi:transglycosylase domain-containing protein [Neobacillus sp. OS1-2]|uniref:transglycosylase domain-containing protein n=1 Tax=Neobacillus sp. OS1-2 TaxID=3070680 RepID=UPI0027E1FE36|nr:transglycosylase domain-containing protein [Neobacillus sp. OS1-2]WML40861.1 transglycosylase domain-containing protein [Neobacillus sp. OS1-2]